MSFNNLRYDNCAYEKQLQENLSEFQYTMDDSKYVNCNKCRMVKGIVDGNDVSQISGNLVDLESNLFGITRSASQCADNQWRSNCNNLIHIPSSPFQSEVNINTSTLNLPECQMFSYNPLAIPNYQPNQCPQPVYTPLPSK